MTRVIVTGGSGKLGRACVSDLLAHGFDVVNADASAPAESNCPFVKVDLTNLDDTMRLLAGMDWEHHRGVEAIVHLAAIPMPGRLPNGEVFAVNTLSTYNVFEAARRLGIKNVIWASSETLLGIPYETPPPYVPVDEETPSTPETAYSLSKLVGEELAKQFCRWDAQQKIICLRFSNVMDPSEYSTFPSFEKSPGSRRFNLWGYIDARDGAQAVRKSLQANLTGAHTFVIANSDTVMSRPNAELLAEFYPTVPVRGKLGPNESLLSIEKAKRVLGYRPEFDWRKNL